MGAARMAGPWFADQPPLVAGQGRLMIALLTLLALQGCAPKEPVRPVQVLPIPVAPDADWTTGTFMTIVQLVHAPGVRDGTPCSCDLVDLTCEASDDTLRMRFQVHGDWPAELPPFASCAAGEHTGRVELRRTPPTPVAWVDGRGRVILPRAGPSAGVMGMVPVEAVGVQAPEAAVTSGLLCRRVGSRLQVQAGLPGDSVAAGEGWCQLEGEPDLAVRVVVVDYVP